ncbi:ABC transporter permease subunit [Dactylosporangium sp. NPDC051541]|uniref:ABC transporter permease subunit n=1 Tax=Dactylosporangium sp. NPDC051541 TaxID=3363977 RepID=UPI00378B480F
MTHLFAAEWARLFSRRITIVTLVLVATAMAFLTFGYTLTGSSPTAAEKARAEERAVSLGQLWDQRTDRCGKVRSGLEQAEPNENFPKNCDYGARPTRDSLLDYGFSFTRQWPSLFYGAALLLALAGFVLGASFVGVEWSSGGMAGLLLWAPRRSRVLGAKLLAAMAGTGLVALVYLALWTGAFLAIAAGGDTVGFTAGEFGSLALTALRVVFLAMAGTALGFSIASIGRHTSAALGVGISYLLLWEFGSTLVFTVVETPRDYAEPYRLSTYARSWLRMGLDQVQSGVEGSSLRPRFEPAWGASGVVITLVALVIAAVAFLTMNRRDAR